MTHGRHEEAFADGKGRGQRIIEGGSAWLTAVPPAARQHVAAEFPVAFLDDEAGRRLRHIAHHGLLSPVGKIGRRPCREAGRRPSFLSGVKERGWIFRRLVEGPPFLERVEREIGRASCRERVCQYV